MRHLNYALKYLMFLTLPFTVWLSFTGEGWITFLPLIYAFGIVPSMELLLQKQTANFSTQLEEELTRSRWFDVMLYAAVLSHLGCFVWFLSFAAALPFTVETVGKTIGLGLMCGVIGINVAHELGHRTDKLNQHIAKLLLLTSLYMHFFIEHNRGHHRNVSTPEDPSSARLGENLYAFWVRSVVFAWISAWKLENKRLSKLGLGWFTWQNEMLRFQVYQAMLLVGIYFFLGLKAMLLFAIAATIGFLLLETVNYIEHYGLSRKKVTENRYEAAGPEHSWNSDHLMGRTLLFELSRHSDHHFQPARPYQILRHYDESPQMPTGYPGMMLLSAIPPLWFAVMHQQPALKVHLHPST